MLTQDDAQSIIQAGITAPSGDNLQPWRIQWDGKKTINISIRDLEVDKSLFNLIYNGQKLVSLITIGTVVENIRVCARHLGYATYPVYAPSSFAKDVVVKIECVQKGLGIKGNHSLYPFIFKRCTNRKIYKGTPINSEVKERILKNTQMYQNIHMYWIDEKDVIGKLAQWATVADQIMFETEGLLKPLMDSIRWTKAQAEATRDGLPIETLELGWIKSQSFRLFACWPLVKILNYGGLSRFASQQAGTLVKSSSALGLLTLEDQENLSGYIQGGEVLERFWLQTTVENISLQPMAGMIFLMNRVSLLNGQGLSSKHNIQIRSISKEFNQQFQLKKNQIPLILFRLGYARPSFVKTLRRNNGVHSQT